MSTLGPQETVSMMYMFLLLFEALLFGLFTSARCSRDAPRCSRDIAEISPRYRRDVAEMSARYRQ